LLYLVVLTLIHVDILNHVDRISHVDSVCGHPNIESHVEQLIMLIL